VTEPVRGGADRRPGAVPDDDGDPPAAGDVRVPGDVHGGVDTDADGLPDTLVDADGADLLVLTDLDGDALADRVLRIGPDGAVHRDHPTAAVAAPGPDDAPGAGGVPSAVTSRATGWWDGLLGALLGAGR
jgi:hypothetical protein